MTREEREEFEKELKHEPTKGMKKAHREEFGIDGAFDSDEQILGANTIEPIYIPSKLEVESKPNHYDIGIDTFQRMRANATFEEAMGFIRWNIDKYNTRQKGQDEEDYIKIESYCKEARWWFNNKRG